MKEATIRGAIRFPICQASQTKNRATTNSSKVGLIAHSVSHIGVRTQWKPVRSGRGGAQGSEEFYDCLGRIRDGMESGKNDELALLITLAGENARQAFLDSGFAGLGLLRRANIQVVTALPAGCERSKRHLESAILI